MIQQLKELGISPEDPGLSSNTHVTLHNYL